MSERILLDIEGGTACITLNRPEKLNVLDPDMIAQLEAALTRLEREPEVRAVLLTGAGEKAFSVGADINAWGALEPLEMWRSWVREGHRVFERLAQLRQPVLAVLNGYTFGGGLELALAADLRLAAEHVELALPEAKLGTVPGWAGTARLPQLIGGARAKQMIFTGARISAAKAETWGLVNEVVPKEQLWQRARELAAEIAGNAPIAVQTAKQLINSGGAATAPILEALGGAMTAYTADLKEGLAAFRERRPAQFHGR